MCSTAQRSPRPRIDGLASACTALRAHALRRAVPQLEAQISLMETDDFPESLPWFPEEPELLAPGHPLREILEEGPSADAATKKARDSPRSTLAGHA